MNLGKSFKLEREKCGLSQRQMAAILGVTSSALSKIESGKNWPKKKTIDTLCRHTGIPLAYFYHKAMEEADFGVKVEPTVL